MSSKQQRDHNRPPEAKKLKKELGRAWKAILEALEKGRRPPEEEAAKITRFCTEYNLFAAREWQDKWRACATQVAMVLSLMEKDDFPAARAAADQVYRLIKACHNEYK